MPFGFFTPNEVWNSFLAVIILCVRSENSCCKSLLSEDLFRDQFLSIQIIFFMKYLDILLGRSLKIFFGQMETVTWVLLFSGALAACVASALSSISIASTIKRQMPLAMLTNTACAIFIIYRSKMTPLNRKELLEMMARGEVTNGQILKKYGFLIFGYLNLIFWGGWFLCGLLLIIFLGNK